jgi:glycosyltransferase involved in cell wall biosynthesis
VRKLRVGVWIGDGYKPEAGGGFGYYTQLISKIKTYSFAGAEVSFITNGTTSSDLNCYQIKWRPLRHKKIRSLLLNTVRWIPFMRKTEAALTNQEKEHSKKLNEELKNVVDLIYYPTPECAFPDFPFIYTLWDSGHLSTFGFPEVLMHGEFENRKAHYDLIPYKAQMVFAESEAGKKEIEYYYRINPERIKVVPIFPSPIIEANYSSVCPKGIDNTTYFIHYPAQFWAHKNHYNLILAFKTLLASFPDLKLVFTGSDKGNKAYLFSLINDLGISQNVIDLGFVSMEELKWLYLHSQGLVMPTFLGPTNMPLLEAAELGCPVACSNLKGQMEQLGEYGYYFDPAKPEQIVAAVTDMLLDRKKGHIRPYIKLFTIDNALKSIGNAFSEIRNIRFTWE